MRETFLAISIFLAEYTFWIALLYICDVEPPKWATPTVAILLATTIGTAAWRN